MEWLQQALAQVGEWFQDDNVKVGAGVVGGAIFTALVGWWRRRKEKPERVRINVDAPPDQVINIHVAQNSIKR